MALKRVQEVDSLMLQRAMDKMKEAGAHYENKMNDVIFQNGVQFVDLYDTYKVGSTIVWWGVSSYGARSHMRATTRKAASYGASFAHASDHTEGATSEEVIRNGRVSSDALRPERMQ